MAIRLRGEHDGEPIRLLVPAGESVVGTGTQADLRVRAPTISRRHAAVEARGDELRVRDLGSSNGTRIDGRRIDGEARARPGQVLQLGDVRLDVEIVSESDARVAAELPAAEAPPAASAAATLAPITLDRLAFEHLPRLLAAARRGASRPEFARRIGEAVWDALPLATLRVSDPAGGVLFEAGDREAEAAATEVEGLRLAFAFCAATDPAQEQHLSELVGALIGLVPDEPRAPPPVPGDADALPEPPPLDPDVQRIYHRARRAARSGIAVLIRGESGTGKELLARFLHAHSAVGNGPFVAVNCAALSSDLLEAELFGIEKGVATGVDARAGCFERAHGGTLFLDEIGDMPSDTQAKILRVVQEGEVIRVGGSAGTPARPRLISATNRDLEQLLRDDRFRLDLLHRIAGWEVTLPPLRERPADLANLALHFLGRYCRENGVTVRGISESALAVLRAYPWPGNVRELQQEMHRLSVFLGDGDVLSVDDLGAAIREARPARESGDTLEQRMAAHERMLLKQALATHDGNVSRAADSLGVARSTLYRRMAQLGLGEA
jgi:hypothetical protein